MEDKEKILDMIERALEIGRRSSVGAETCLRRFDKIMKVQAKWPCDRKRKQRLYKRALAKAKQWNTQERRVLEYIASGDGLRGKEYVP